jgi:hypothetical protein
MTTNLENAIKQYLDAVQATNISFRQNQLTCSLCQLTFTAPPLQPQNFATSSLLNDSINAQDPQRWLASIILSLCAIQDFQSMDWISSSYSLRLTKDAQGMPQIVQNPNSSQTAFQRIEIRSHYTLLNSDFLTKAQ